MNKPNRTTGMKIREALKVTRREERGDNGGNKGKGLDKEHA